MKFSCPSNLVCCHLNVHNRVEFSFQLNLLDRLSFLPQITQNTWQYKFNDAKITLLAKVYGLQAYLEYKSNLLWIVLLGLLFFCSPYWLIYLVKAH